MNRLLTCAVVALAHQANAGVVINIVQVDGNVSLLLTGSMNTGALGEAVPGGVPDFLVPSGIIPSAGQIGTTDDPVGSEFLDAYYISVDGDTAFAPFGPGANLEFWDSVSGDAFGVNSDFLGTGPLMVLPAGYTSGDSLFATALKLEATIASLGMEEGTYVTTLANGTVSDTVTVNVGVPAPGALAFIGLGGLAVARRRR